MDSETVKPQRAGWPLFTALAAGFVAACAVGTPYGPYALMMYLPFAFTLVWAYTGAPRALAKAGRPAPTPEEVGSQNRKRRVQASLSHTVFK